MSYPYHFFHGQIFQESKWKLPLSLAISVHILVFILLIMPPTFLSSDHDLSDIQTIDLFTADEIPQLKEQQPAKSTPPPPQETQKPAAQVKSIAIEPAPASSPAKVISLRPRKLKKRIKPVKEEKEDLRQKALARIQATVEKKKQEQQIKHDLSSLRDNLHSSVEAKEEVDAPPQPTTPQSSNEQTTANPGASSKGMRAIRNEALKRYYTAIHRKINKYWALPPSENWDNLEAVYVIIIRPNGTISKSFFEKKSKNSRFNQHVERLIQAAQPLPPFPSFIKENKLDIGLKISSGGVW